MLRVFYVLLFLSQNTFIVRIRQTEYFHRANRHYQGSSSIQCPRQIQDGRNGNCNGSARGAQMTRDHYRSPFYSFGGKRARMCNVHNYTHWIILTGKYIFKKTLDKVKVNVTVSFTSSCNTPTSNNSNISRHFKRNAIHNIETMALNVEPLWKADIQINLTHLKQSSHNTYKLNAALYKWDQIKDI